MDSIKVANGIIKHGDPVSATTIQGEVIEGNVFDILPYGAEFIDPEWTDACVVIEDHESHKRVHFRPSKVYKCS